MHGCAVLFIGFFLKPKNDRYKLEDSSFLVLGGNFGQKKRDPFDVTRAADRLDAWLYIRSLPD